MNATAALPTSQARSEYFHMMVAAANKYGVNWKTALYAELTWRKNNAKTTLARHAAEYQLTILARAN